MTEQQKTRRFALLGLGIFIPVQAGLMMADRFWPEHPHLGRYLALFLAVKLVGDLIYYRLWPDYKAWVQIRFYISEEVLSFYRFGFPASVGQRILEVILFPNAAFGAAPATLLHHLVAGPVLAVMVYLANRWLVESAQDAAHIERHDTTHLP